MKTIVKLCVFSLFIASGHCIGQEQKSLESQKEILMKTYVIERDIPNAGDMPKEELRAISKRSCGVVNKLGKGIEWQHSYVTGNKIFCVYNAENENLVRKHGEEGSFPITEIREVAAVISPATAEN